MSSPLNCGRSTQRTMAKSYFYMTPTCIAALMHSCTAFIDDILILKVENKYIVIFSRRKIPTNQRLQNVDSKDRYSESPSN